MSGAPQRPTRQTVAAARTDPVVFAEALTGVPLWPHQAEVVRSKAPIRVLISGRQAGKSLTMGMLALHEAFSAPGKVVLIISATDDAAKNLLRTITNLASAPLLAGSVVDENASKLTLTNGSMVRSIPASQKQARGLSVDLLILDEACFLEEELWVAARWTTIAKAASRTVMASTPYGKIDHFCAVSYRAGLPETRKPGYESFHWPSTVNPLVDQALLDMWRETSTDREYRREVLAEWVDDAGQYFSQAELDAMFDAGYPATAPADANRRPGVAGVDWGFSHDANALVVVSRDEELAKQRAVKSVYAIPHLEEHFALPYAAFISKVVDVACGYRLTHIAAEENGVGGMPVQELDKALRLRPTGATATGVYTDARLKENGFGFVKMLAQQNRLAFPRHPSLMRQLSALEYDTLDSGLTRISVPERSGHDDLCMSLVLAADHLMATDSRETAPPTTIPVLRRLEWRPWEQSRVGEASNWNAIAGGTWRPW